MTSKKLYNFRLPITLMQQVDTVADNRTEFITKAVQDALQKEIATSEGATDQLLLHDYIRYLKAEVAEWKAAAGVAPGKAPTDDPHPGSGDVHSEIDQALRTFQEKRQHPKEE